MRLIRVLPLFVLAGCASQPPAQVKGTAAYRELMLLPDSARLDATLVDVSKADANAPVIGRAREIVHPGNPTAFVIPYDPARIDPNGRYAVRARIFADGKLLFNTDQHYPLDEVVSLTLRKASDKQ